MWIVIPKGIWVDWLSKLIDILIILSQFASLFYTVAKYSSTLLGVSSGPLRRLLHLRKVWSTFFILEIGPYYRETNHSRRT